MKEILDLIYTRKVLLQQATDKINTEWPYNDCMEWHITIWYDKWRKEELIKTTKLLDEIIEKIIDIN